MAEGISVGSVSVSVVPDASQFARLLGPQVTAAGDAIGKQIGDRITAKIGDSISRGISEGALRAAGQSGRAGEASGGAFADSFRARVTAALHDLPTPRVGVDATAADAELADLRARLAALSNVRVGVDITSAEALAELDRLRARIDELGAQTPDIGVRVDAARASEELAAVRAEVNSLDGSTAHINVDADTSQALAGLSGLTTAALTLGPALVPIGGAATAGLAGLATTAATGAGALGVLALGASAASNAMGLLSKEHEAVAANAARSAASAGSSAAAQVSAANQVKSAEASLAQTRANADNQAISAAEQVKNARRSLADAERTAAHQQESAARAVIAAETAEAQANQRLADAQQAVHDARLQAARDLESAANRAVDAQLAAQQAAIDVTTAQATYDTVTKSGTSTQVQRQQATLDLAKAQQALIEANQAAAEAQQDNTAAQQAGVDGAPAVIAANRQVTAATANQLQAVQQLADAQAAQTEQARASAESIAKAEQALTDAQRAQSVQRQQSAFAIAQAERSVASALAAQGRASQSAGVAGSAALDKIHASLAKVNPAVLAFATFLTGTVEPVFNRLKDAAAAGLFPGIEAGLKAMAPLVGPFTAFIAGLAKVMGDLFEQAGKALTSPFWVQFFSYVSQTAGPTLAIMAHVIGSLITGFAGLMQAFAPVVTQMGGGIARLAGDFARFGAGAGSNSGFQGFLRYLERTGPLVVSTIGHLATAIGHIVTALAPLGPPILIGIRGFADIVNAIPTPVLTAIAAGVIAIVAGLKAWAIVQAILNGLVLIWDTLTSPWLILMAGAAVTILAVVAAVAALGFGIYELVKHWTAVWNAIKATVEAVYNWVRDHWPLLLEIIAAPFTGGASLVLTHLGLIRDAATAVVHWVSGKFDDLVGFFTGMHARIARAASGMWDGISTAFKAAIDVIIGWWDGFVSHLKIPGFHVDTHIPGVGKVGFDGLDIGKDLHIPYLASGGVATAATLGVFGEAGREAILPLSDPNAMRMIADALRPAGSDGAQLEGALYLDSGEFLGVVRGQVRQVVAAHDQRNVVLARKGAR